jgi:hypothetical protein
MGAASTLRKFAPKPSNWSSPRPRNAARLSEAETLDFIFRPGFSTAEQVTEVSGRGVGMDVVQSVLHRLKASISVETRLGQGTTFRLNLPLTLAIIKALLFWVEQRLYAIPLNAVLEIARTFELRFTRSTTTKFAAAQPGVAAAAAGASGQHGRSARPSCSFSLSRWAKEVRIDCRFTGRRRRIGDQGVG